MIGLLVFLILLPVLQGAETRNPMLHFLFLCTKEKNYAMEPYLRKFNHDQLICKVHIAALILVRYKDDWENINKEVKCLWLVE